MKLLKKTCLVICLTLAACALIISSTHAGSNATGKKTAPTAASTEAAAMPSDAFTQSKAWAKVGANLQQAYLAAEKTGFPGNERLTCFVKANENILEGDQSFLTSNGFIVQIASGFTARGQMDLKSLPAVANLPFVQRIDIVK